MKRNRTMHDYILFLLAYCRNTSGEYDELTLGQAFCGDFSFANPELSLLERKDEEKIYKFAQENFTS